MEEEQDLVVLVDDEGKEITMEVLDYFFYEGQEYAVMIEYAEHSEDCDCGKESCESCDDDEQQEAYIMRVVPVDDDQEEFVPVEEELLEKLIDFVQNEMYDDDDFDEDDEEDDEEGEDTEE